MTYKEVLNAMREFNKKHNINRKVENRVNANGQQIKMVARVVMSQKLFKGPMPIEPRTYTFNNYNKALCSSDLGYSIFAYCEFDDTLSRIEYFTDDDFEECTIISMVE